MSSTDPSLSGTTRRRAARAATVALAGIAYFVVALVALHLLRPDHDPIRQTTSQYAVGRYGLLMTSAFLSMSVASFALVIGLHHGVSQPARSRVGLGLLTLWGVGVLIAMCFPINLDGTPPTTSGIIHRINGPLAFLSLTAGMILLSRRLKHDPRWHPLHRSALILSLVMLALFVVTFLNIVTGFGFAGLAQRMSLAVVVLWYLLAAGQLRSLRGASAAGGSVL